MVAWKLFATRRRLSIRREFVAIITIAINVATLLLMTYIATGSANLDNVAAGFGLGKIDLSFMAIGVGIGLVLAFIITFFSAGFMGRGALKRLAKAK